MTNLRKTWNQASDRHKNNRCLTGTRDGVPTNLTKITKKANIAKTANLSSNSSKKQVLKTNKERAHHKYKKMLKTTNFEKHQIKRQIQKWLLFMTEKGRGPQKYKIDATNLYIKNSKWSKRNIFKAGSGNYSNYFLIQWQWLRKGVVSSFWIPSNLRSYNLLSNGWNDSFLYMRDWMTWYLSQWINCNKTWSTSGPWSRNTEAKHFQHVFLTLLFSESKQRELWLTQLSFTEPIGAHDAYKRIFAISESKLFFQVFSQILLVSSVINL